MQEPTEKPHSNRSFVATVLIVIGIIWMSLTGLCTAAFLGLSFSQGDLKSVIEFLPVALTFAALSLVFGLMIWGIGRALRNRRRS